MSKTTKKWVSAGVLIALLAVAAPIPATAQPATAPVLNDGPWSGLMAIRGNATGTIEGAPVEFRVDVEGFFDILIGTEFIASEGRTSGTDLFALEGGSWSLGGNWDFEAPIPDSGGTGVVRWTVDGTGGFEGNPAELSHVGTITSSGFITAEVGGAVRTVGLGTVSSDARMEVRLDSARCNEAYGDFSISLDEAIQQQGLSTNLEGPWVAFRDTQAITDAVSSWREDMRAAGFGSEAIPDGEALPEIVRLFGEILSEYNAWSDDHNAADVGGDNTALWDRTADLINDQAIFLARLRNISDCDALVLDPDLLQQFESLIKQAMLAEIGTLVRDRGLNADQLQIVTVLAVNAGAIGAAGPEPVATQTEEVLRQATEDILVKNLLSGEQDGTGENGLDIAVPEVQKALALAASMNWSFMLDGKTQDAARLWERAQLSLAEGTSSGEEGGS